MADSSFAGLVVERLLADLPDNTEMSARLRRGDNPGTEYMAWEYLVRLGVQLQDDRNRQSVALVAAALARDKPNKDGDLGIARCLALADAGSGEDGSASIRFRRLLACDSSAEAYRIVRSMLRLVVAKVPGRLCYQRLLEDLLYFGPKVKERWAQEYYSYNKKEGGKE